MPPFSLEVPRDLRSADAPAADPFRFCRALPHVGMGMADPVTGRWLDVNDTLCALLGYSREELLAMTVLDVTHPADIDASAAHLADIWSGRTDSYQHDKRYVRKDGTAVWVALDVRRMSQPDGTPFVLGAVVDITERVRAAQAARDAAALLDRFSENVPGILYEFVRHPDGHMQVPYSSRGLAGLLDLPAGSLRENAATFFAHVHPDDQLAMRESITASARDLSPWALEFRVNGSRGERWLRGDARPYRRDDGATHWYGLLSDITAIRAQQQALADSERQLRFLFEHASEGILVFDVDAAVYIDVNPMAEAILGYPTGALLGLSPLDLSADVQPGGEPKHDYVRRLVAAAEAGRPVVSVWHGKHADGHIVPCELRITALPVGGRRLLRGAIVDISERLRARETVDRLQQAIESAVHAVAMADTSGRLTYVNQAFLALWGYQTDEDVLGRSALTFWRSPEEAQVVIGSLAQQGSWAGELVATRADGRACTLQLNASAIRNERGEMTGMLASFADVTETRRLEQELNQSQKLESIGRLAGGVAHDFNNLLTVIKASLDLALAELPADSSARTDLAEITKAADSAARLTQQLLAFSRKQVIAPTTLNLNEVVHRVAGMLQRLLGEDIVLRSVTAHDLGFVRFDVGQAEQMLVNMAVNARDAMPAGGVLTLETRNVSVDDGFARHHPGLSPGEYVLLEVTDTGEGMTPEVLAHAFEPFFTTKPAGRGTGLGLAVIHGAVTQNGGRVDVHSVVGEGTTFHVYLPRVAPPAALAESTVLPPLPRGHEVILLVEDDAAVRQLEQRLLVQQGYRVVAFTSGPQAIQWLEGCTDPVDLLLTDVIMPGMNGKQLADAVIARRPGTRVLYAYGYTANVIAHHGVLDADIPFLPKPFSARELATAVREVLGAS